jgi:hypothetical protein
MDLDIQQEMNGLSDGFKTYTFSNGTSLNVTSPLSLFQITKDAKSGVYYFTLNNTLVNQDTNETIVMTAATQKDKVELKFIIMIKKNNPPTLNQPVSTTLDVHWN